MDSKSKNINKQFNDTRRMRTWLKQSLCGGEKTKQSPQRSIVLCTISTRGNQVSRSLAPELRKPSHFPVVPYQHRLNLFCDQVRFHTIKVWARVHYMARVPAAGARSTSAKSRTLSWNDLPDLYIRKLEIYDAPRLIMPKIK